MLGVGVDRSEDGGLGQAPCELTHTSRPPPHEDNPGASLVTSHTVQWKCLGCGVYRDGIHLSVILAGIDEASRCSREILKREKWSYGQPSLPT